MASPVKLTSRRMRGKRPSYQEEEEEDDHEIEREEPSQRRNRRPGKGRQALVFLYGCLQTLYQGRSWPVRSPANTPKEFTSVPLGTEPVEEDDYEVDDAEEEAPQPKRGRTGVLPLGGSMAAWHSSSVLALNRQPCTAGLQVVLPRSLCGVASEPICMLCDGCCACYAARGTASQGKGRPPRPSGDGRATAAAAGKC